MAVIRPIIETDPAELESIAIDYLRVAMPDWDPADGDLMSWLIGAHARMVAEERDLAADVPFEQILRPLGEQVHRILPYLPAPATATAEVTLQDAAGYTIPAGMEVLVRTSGDDGVTMVVDQTVVVRRADNTTTATVRLRAAPGREGAAGNGLEHPAPVIPLRALEFVKGIRLTSKSAGGSDGETDEEYYQRLVDALALTSQVPVLADDFAGIARQDPSVGRALAVNRHLWRPEILELKLVGSATLSMPGLIRAVSLTAAMTATAVRDAFTGAGLTATVVAGATLNNTTPMRIEISGKAQYGPWTLTTAASSTATFALVQIGGERNPVDHAVAVAVVNDRGDELAPTDRESVMQRLEERRELNWKISVINPSYTYVDVIARAVAWPAYDSATVQPSADAALRAFLSPATWGRGETRIDGVGVDWIDEPVVRYLEVAQVLNEVPGLRYITELSIRASGGTFGSRDVELLGLAPLPRVGSISVEIAEG